MKHSFLCANHKLWLNHFPQQAIHCYSNACDIGWIYYQDGSWAEAVKFFGTAYETAEILLSSKVIELNQAIDCFLNSLAGLTQALIRLEQEHSCKEILFSAINRLNHEPSNDADSKARLQTEVERLSNELCDLYSGNYKFSHKHPAEALPNHWNRTLH